MCKIKECLHKNDLICRWCKIKGGHYYFMADNSWVKVRIKSVDLK